MRTVVLLNHSVLFGFVFAASRVFLVGTVSSPVAAGKR